MPEKPDPDAASDGSREEIDLGADEEAALDAAWEKLDAAGDEAEG